MLRKIKKVLFYVSLIAFSVVYITATHYFIERYQHEHELPVLWHSTLDFFYPDDTSCYRKDGDYLMSIEKKAVLPDSIFIIETTCQRNLGAREACTIEAIARSHPDKFVYVLFTRPLTEKECFRGPLGEANKFLNVHFYRANISTYALHTPLEEIFNGSLTSHGKRHHRRMAEYLKFLTLYHYGGLVVDLDMLVTAATDHLGSNWLVREDDGRIGSAVVSLSRDRVGRKVTPLVLSALKDQDQAHSEEIDSGKALYQVLRSICSTTSIDGMNESTCDGLKIYDSKLFYPVKRTNWQDYFSPGEPPSESLGYYLWSSESRRAPVGKDSMYASLAKGYCPNVFRKYSRLLIKRF
ncbi:lactosylceramide 4-alpha-galactosyltransferase-like [Choristoneura fumiferana]|uniref:lactosylceramide 4-alpha-galactosyltransferase-like n=1 Tax=Choristoneura fumiferana TaxID=7141 RepID=UPI003D157C43